MPDPAPDVPLGYKQGLTTTLDICLVIDPEAESARHAPPVARSPPPLSEIRTMRPGRPTFFGSVSERMHVMSNTSARELRALNLSHI